MRALVVASLLLTSAAWGQTPPAAVPAPTGTVTGHVLFADTRQPARLVEVNLALRPGKAEAEAEAHIYEGGKMPVQKAPVVSSIAGRTGLDGSFAISDVPPGEYYAIAKQAGFIVPLAAIPDQKTAQDPDTVMRNVPRVTVRPNTISEIDLELHRGASIAGRVQFEDGAPLTGAFIHAELADSEEHNLSIRPYYLQRATENESDRILTDSDGRFFIVGLRPGKYTVMTDITTRGGLRTVSNGTSTNFENSKGGRASISVYAPGAFHRKEAQVFEIKGNERVEDVHIEVRFSAVHSVRGTVLSKADRHAPNDAYVELKDEQDKLFRRGSVVRDDGSFELLQVPAGTYTLNVDNAQDFADPDTLDRQQMPVVLRKFVSIKSIIVVLDADVPVPEILLEESRDPHPNLDTTARIRHP